MVKERWGDKGIYSSLIYINSGLPGEWPRAGSTLQNFNRRLSIAVSFHDYSIIDLNSTIYRPRHFYSICMYNMEYIEGNFIIISSYFFVKIIYQTDNSYPVLTNPFLGYSI